tara:strand:- start:772 stop:1536 length:765 start_codon:yes stop_codon:yes gene_type:complete
MKRKIMVLAVESRTTWMITNALLNAHSNVEVVFLEKQSKIKILISRYKKNGLLNAVGQLIFFVFSKIFISQRSKYVKDLISQANLVDHNISDLKVVKLSSEEDINLVKYLKNFDPDIVVVNGTKILSKRILDSCNAKFINLHCGITPTYRGVHGAYWALVNNDIKNCGVTIHEVDYGIDTGLVYYQERINISESDNFNVYPYKQYISGIPLMLQAIKDIQENKVFNFQNNQPSKLYQHPTIIEYLHSRFKFGIK